jgi:hypothetical protein
VVLAVAGCLSLLLPSAAAAAPPGRAIPESMLAPAITGNAVEQQSLSASTGSWSERPRSYAFAWQRCDSVGQGCGAIAGASAATYSSSAADVGHTLRVKVTASNKYGSASASSTPSAVVTAAAPPPPPPPPDPASGLHVSGNRLLDAAGAVVHLHGVNRSGTEYACIQGWGIFDGPTDDASVAALRSWNANIVHLGLNEDCILGINGVPAAYAGSNYMNAVVAFVNRLHAQGLYAEVSLMWAAPGTQQASGHPAILDQDHSPAALRAIANAFKGDPDTIIGLQSEPHGIAWPCWRDGGSACSVGYAALGMQGALDAVRSTGATNPVTVSGIDYANNLTQWLAYKPADPLGQLVAEAHVYGKNACATTACFDANYAPVAAQLPLVFGEFGETYDDSSCGATNVSAFLGWAEAHGVGYEAWTWNIWGTCGSLISNFNGTPAGTYGSWIKSHYATQP